MKFSYDKTNCHWELLFRIVFVIRNDKASVWYINGQSGIKRTPCDLWDKEKVVFKDRLPLKTGSSHMKISD